MSDPDTSKIIKKEETDEDATRKTEGETDYTNWFKGEKGREAKRDLDSVFGLD
jgi:hypothetical protein